MPTIAHANIPPPKSWDEFEDIVLSAAKIRWSSTDFHRHGRSGQSQQGVDVYGHDDRGHHLGLQGKNTVEGITHKVLIEEITKAEAFVPPLDSLYFATTVKRDAKVQKFVREISVARRKESKFSVGILFWDDIVQDLSRDESEFFKHYPQLRPNPTPVAATASAGPFPSMSLHDLFLHIDPDAFEKDKKTVVGQDVKDRLSTGQLHSWGREIQSSRRLALAPIPAAFWKDATFTYNFADAAPSVWDARSANGQDYAEIMVNRAEVVVIWPPPDRLIPLHEAAEELYGEVSETNLGRFTRDKAPTKTLLLDSIGNLIAWRTEKLTVRRPGSSKRIPFDRRHLRYMSVSDGAMSLRSHSRSRDVEYTDPAINRAELNRITAEVKETADQQ